MVRLALTEASYSAPNREWIEDFLSTKSHDTRIRKQIKKYFAWTVDVSQQPRRLQKSIRVPAPRALIRVYSIIEP